MKKQTTEKTRIILTFAIALLSFFVFSIDSFAANYPLEITNIKPAGTGNPTISASNRIFRAYPGLVYNIRAAVIGGSYPYKFSLSNAPSGMSVDEKTGEIIWPNPQASAENIIISVIDSEDSVATAGWSIEVSTNGFYFVDASVPDGGDGSMSLPWNNWNDFYLGRTDSSYNNAILYFKNGTYTYPANLTHTTAGSSNRLNLINHPRTYLSYPGHNPVFDGEDYGNKIHLSVSGNDYYFDGIKFINGYGFGIEIDSGSYFTARKCIFENMSSSGSSSNQGAISFRFDALHPDETVCTLAPVCTYPPEDISTFKNFPVVQDNTFRNFTLNTAGLEFYGNRKGVYEDNKFHNINWQNINIKSSNVLQFFRNNYLDSNSSQVSINIPAQFYSNELEISHNYLGSGIQVGSYDGESGPTVVHLYRNTIKGKLFFRSIQEDDGPVYISNNVIINSDPADHIRDQIGEHYSITANRSILGENLFGLPDDNIIDSEGNLTENYSQYLGCMGWQIPDNHDTVSPNSPSGLHIS